MEDEPTPAAADDEESMTRPDKLTLTPEQQARIGLMRAIAEQVTADSGDNFVLKGGTALLLAYGLPRYSTDLDFDGKRPEPNMAKSIERVIAAQPVAAAQLNLKKNTATTRRYMLHYPASRNLPLKIETSYRQGSTIEESDVTVINGIRVYKIEKLAELKAAAFLDRLNGRDIYDVAFLLTNYPAAIGEDQRAQIKAKIAEVGPDQLLAIMQDDDVLSQHDLDRVVLELEERLSRSEPQS